MRKRKPRPKDYQANIQKLHQDRFDAGKLAWTVTANRILREVAQDHMVGVVDIRSKLRFPYLVVARRDATARMRAAKLQVDQIAAAINRDHSTISHYIYPSFQVRKRERRRTYAEARAV